MGMTGRGGDKEKERKRKKKDPRNRSGLPTRVIYRLFILLLKGSVGWMAPDDAIWRAGNK